MNAGAAGGSIVQVHHGTTVQGIEVAWILLLGLGSLATLYCLTSAILDYRVTREVGLNGDREMLAQAAIRSEAIRLLQQVVLVAIGVWAATIPAAPPHHQSLFERAITTAFFVFGGALTLNSILDLIVRRRFLVGRRRETSEGGEP